MNPIVLITLIFACVGLVDRIFGGKKHLAVPMEQGFAQCGELLIDICGVYVITQNYTDIISRWGNDFSFGRFDLAALVGSLLASDMGGYNLCKSITRDSLFGIYAGTVIAGTLGGLTSFFIPVYLGFIQGEDRTCMLKGFLYGLIVLPIPMFLSGILWGIPLEKLIINLLPVICICIILVWFLKRKPNRVLAVFQKMGNIMRFLIGVAFLWTVGALYFPEKFELNQELIQETIVMIVKMTINVSGALVIMELFQRLARNFLKKLENRLGINQWSIMGFLIGMPTGIAILPIYHKMDDKGKVLNAAFCVSGHYMLGGQMALIAGMESNKHFAIYMINKAMGALLAVTVALYMEKRGEVTHK